MHRFPQSRLALAKSRRGSVEGAVQTVRRLSQRLQGPAAAALVNQLLARSPELLRAAFISEPKERMDHSSAASSATSGLGESWLCLAGSSPATAASPRARDALAVRRRGYIQGGHSILGIVLVPPTAVILALIQAAGLSNADNPVHSSLLPHC